MKKIARIIFKIHRKLFGYPARSEVRLVMEFTNTNHMGISSTVGMLYVCGESLDEICDWTCLSKNKVKEELNSIVDIVGE